MHKKGGLDKKRGEKLDYSLTYCVSKYTSPLISIEVVAVATIIIYFYSVDTLHHPNELFNKIVTRDRAKTKQKDKNLQWSDVFFSYKIKKQDRIVNDSLS